MIYVKMAFENTYITDTGYLYSLEISLPKYLLIAVVVLRQEGTGQGTTIKA